jgi:hypothetical protein
VTSTERVRAWVAKKIAEDPEGFKAKQRAKRQQAKERDVDGVRKYFREYARKRLAGMSPEEKEAHLAKRKAYHAQNRDKIAAKKREWRRGRTQEQLAAQKEYDRKRREENPDKTKAWMDSWRERNRDHIAAYNESIKDYRLKKNQEWRAANRDRINARARQRHISDVNYSIKKRLGARLRLAMRRAKAKKSYPTMELVGCEMPVLLSHLESHFKEGMSWDNRDQWHIDHYIPCDAFNLADEAEQKLCFHYLNLRPEWGPDNCSKQDKLPPDWETHMTLLRVSVFFIPLD